MPADADDNRQEEATMSKVRTILTKGYFVPAALLVAVLGVAACDGPQGGNQQGQQQGQQQGGNY